MSSLPAVVASIPSPDVNGFEIGPFRVNFYGIAIALGVIAAIALAARRLEKRGGDPRLMERAGVWGVAAGVLGARAAYVSTHTAEFAGQWHKVFYIWEGGLAFFGGLAAGAAVVLWLMYRGRANLLDVLDSAAPAVPLAQAIGRWGNYFNQELFGTPSTLPWAIEIDPQHRPARYAGFSTFHPTFLYESLLNFALVGLILWLDRRFELARGSLFLVYLFGYGVIRFLMELIRTDTTFRLLGISRNGWVAAIVAIAAAVVFVLWNRRARVGVEDSTG